ncbi:hypothetical protein Efla_003134 [Eimeria flavescens]
MPLQQQGPRARVPAGSPAAGASGPATTGQVVQPVGGGAPAAAVQGPGAAAAAGTPLNNSEAPGPRAQGDPTSSRRSTDSTTASQQQQQQEQQEWPAGVSQEDLDLVAEGLATTAANQRAAAAEVAAEEAAGKRGYSVVHVQEPSRKPSRKNSFLQEGLSDREVEQLREKFGFNEVKPHQVGLFLTFFRVCCPHMASVFLPVRQSSVSVSISALFVGRSVEPVNLSDSKPEWAKLLGRYFGLVPLLLITAALFSVFVKEEGRRDWLSFGLLLFLCNVMVWADYIGERSARNAIAAVERLAAPSCTVQRNGKWVNLKVRELLPGDLVRLRGGVVVPADGIFVSLGASVMLDESALTGESLPVRRYAGGELLSGAVVQQGEGEMRVTKIGAESFYGKTIFLLARAEREGHLRGVLNKAARIITLVASLFAFFLFFWIGWYSSWKLIIPDNRVLISLKRAFILIASVAPAAMPVVTTTVLAVGSLLISKERGLVSRLSAIEEAAGVLTLCSDKTGTLTKNQLTLSKEELEVQPGFSADDVLLAASLAGTLTDPEPIDKAINEQTDLAKRQQFTVLDYVPFNPVDKRTVSTIITPDGQKKQVTKGAPSVIADLVAPPDSQMRQQLEELIISKAKRGFRTLGVAERDLPASSAPQLNKPPSKRAALALRGPPPTGVVEAQGGFGFTAGRHQAAGREGEEVTSSWRLCGYISLFDPPREDTKETLEKARRLGIKVKMVTGDQQAIAVETAKLLGLGSNIVGPEIWRQKEESERQQAGKGGGAPPQPTLINGVEFHAFVEAADGFAGVYPEHKFAIVDALLETHQLVAMTGDGVNDAPALKRATVGIAVSGATDAAKAAADIILLAPGLSTIITVLSLSRQIFRRVEAYIIFRLFTSFIVLVFWWGVHVLLDYMFPAWILVLVSMINDFVLMSCSRDRVPSSREPLIWSMSRVACVSLLMSFICGCSIVVFVVLADPMHDVNWWSAWGLSNFNPDWLVPGHARPMSSQTNAAVWLLLTIMVQTNFHAARTKGFFWAYNEENRVPSPFVLLPQLAACIITLFLSVYWKHSWVVGSGARMSGLSWGQAGVTILWALLFFVFTDCLKVGFYRWVWPRLQQHGRCLPRVDVMSILCGKETEEQADRRSRQQLRELNRAIASRRDRARQALHVFEEVLEDEITAAGVHALRQISRLRSKRAAQDKEQLSRNDLSLRKQPMLPVAKKE